jgi:Fic family protein
MGNRRDDEMGVRRGGETENRSVAGVGGQRHVLFRGGASGKPLSTRQARQALKTLREVAVIRSTESSNRIEGVEAAPERIKALVKESTAPETGSEQAIAGYRDVLGTIHAHHEEMTFSVNLVRQLHRDLFTYTDDKGGDGTPTDNAITEQHPDGPEVVRFEKVPAFQTPEEVGTLHDRFERAWTAGTADKLTSPPT